MTLYNSRQLVVILSIVFALFLFSTLKTVGRESSSVVAINDSPKVVYELRGDIRKQGFYFFNKQQTVAELSRAGGGMEKKTVLSPVDSSKKVKNWSRVVFREYVRVEKMDAPARLNFFMPISVNSASIEDLTLVPGIGSKSAKAIVDYRQDNKGIRDLHDLISVKGLGKKKVGSFMPYLTIKD